MNIKTLNNSIGTVVKKIDELDRQLTRSSDESLVRGLMIARDRHEESLVNLLDLRERFVQGGLV